MSDTSGYQRFFAELKRRKVFRVMAVYGAVGFVLLQVVELLVPALLLPEWTFRFVALLLLVGFPVAIIVAWAFEMTPEGIQRTEDAAAGELPAIASAPTAGDTGDMHCLAGGRAVAAATPAIETNQHTSSGTSQRSTSKAAQTNNPHSRIVWAA